MRSVLFLSGVAVVCMACAGCSSTGAAGMKHGGVAEEAFSPNAKGQALAHYVAAVMYDRAGQSAPALGELKNAARLDPEATTPTFRLIRAYLKQQDYEAALKSTERAIEQMPNRPNLYIVLGEIYNQLKRFDEAVKAFRKAIDLNPKSVLGYGALVEVQENTNDLVAAIDVYHQLIEMTPNAAGLHYQLGTTLARVKDSEGAIRELETALELEPRLIRARYILGSLYLEQGDSAKCVAMLEEYLKQRKDDGKAMEVLAGGLARLHRYDEANAWYAKILAGERPTPQQQIEAAFLMIVSGNPQRAEKLLPPAGAPYFSVFLTAAARQAQGLPFRPLLESLDAIEGDLDEECNASLNDLLYEFGDDLAGTWLLERLAAFRSETRSHSLGVMQGRALMSLKRYDDAVKVFEALLTEFPPEKWAHYYLATCYEELDRFEDTEKHLKAYLEFEPNDPEVLNFLGYLYAEKNVKLDEAEALLKKALENDPANPFYLDSIGWIYYRQGRAKEAVDHIQRAIYGMETDDAVLREHLGDAYLLLGDEKRAVAEWERAQRLDPKLPGIQEKLDQHRKDEKPGKS